MRKIKFRGKDKANNKWLYGNLEIPLLNQNTSKCYIVGYSYGQYKKHEVDSKTVGQFTGVKDKNGQDIYEGDIIRWHDVVTSDYPITYTDGVFCLDEMPDSNFWHHREEISNKWEVVGNIYENK